MKGTIKRLRQVSWIIILVTTILAVIFYFLIITSL